MAPRARTSTAASAAVDTSNTNAVEDLLNRIAELWRGHAHADLETRHQLGQHLNEFLGSPMQRQPHGRRVVATVAERIRLTPGEISRMRRFAYHFESVEDFEQQHPDSIGWDAARGVLADLRRGASRTTSQENELRSTVRRISTRVQTVTASLQELHESWETIDSEARGEIRANICSLIAVASQFVEQQPE